MPNYQFKCEPCDKTELINLSVEHAMEVTCFCGQQMIKVFTPPAIHFKGGGWGGNHGKS